MPLTVVESVPPRLFSFRWAYDPSVAPDQSNSFLVTLELAPSGAGTTLRLTETGFREQGWEAAVLEEAYQDHVAGLEPVPAAAAGVRRPPGVGAVSAVAVDDDLWSAIGDPTRRRMLDLLLTAGPGTATSLSEQLPVTRQAVAKHLLVLDQAGLVHGTTAGRERRYQVDQAQLARAVAQLAVGRRELGRPAAADQADRRGDPART